MAAKGLIRLAGFIVLLFTMAGCLEVSTVVSVKPDGTGTIAERMLMSKASLGQMSSLTEGGKKGQAGQMPDKSALEKKSREIGEGVRFISVRSVVTKTHEGYEALYAFSDINLLQLNRNPDSGVSADSASGDQAPKKKKQYVRFIFKKGIPSRLSIVMDQEKEASLSTSPAVAKPQQNPEQLKMATSIMKQFLKGMRVFMAVDIDGSILSTNATHRKEKRITLMDVDFDKLLSKPKQFASFTALGPDPASEEMQKIMKKIPGIKLETQKEVQVSFQ
jgi:hypothetical protein